jgi:hypothetical protein
MARAIRGQRDHAGHELLRVHALKAGERLQREHHAGEHGGQKDHGNRVDAYADHLAEPFAHVVRGAEHPGNRAPQCVEPDPGLLEEANEAPADAIEDGDHEFT